jgi:polyribonucleotide nucleotidyltransferase
VEILPGKDGLVHVSDMSYEFVKDPSDLVKVGDKVKVRVKEIDELGRLNLSMNLDPGMDRKKDERRGGGRMFGRRGGHRDREGRERSSGPHFPTTRFLGEDKRKFSR